jgi:ATP-dependent RNA helicase DDX46/PRP5
MAHLVRDYGRRQALENEDDDCNLNRKHCRVSSHHHYRDTEPKAAPTTRVQEEGMGTEKQWLDDEMEHHCICIKDWQEKLP